MDNIYNNDDVIQMIPASGWTVIHTDEVGKEIRSVVVCWALTREGAIVPYTSDYRGNTSDPTTDSNFVGITHVDDTIQYTGTGNTWYKKERKI